MKRFKQLFFSCLILGSFTFHSPAKADGHSGSADDSKTNKTNNNDTGTGSPANNNLVFLIVVGVAISGKLITDKIKSVKQ